MAFLPERDVRSEILRWRQVFELLSIERFASFLSQAGLELLMWIG